MVPIWSSASVGGLPLEKYPGFTQKLGQDTFIRAKTSGAEMIKKKTGLPGLLLVSQLLRLFIAIALRQQTHPAVSSVSVDAMDCEEVALSVPTVVGRGGAEQTLEVELWPKEIQALKRSGCSAARDAWQGPCRSELISRLGQSIT